MRANAVNDVIDITTKRAQNTSGPLGTDDGGTAWCGFSGVRCGGVLAPGVHCRVYGKYSDRDRTEFFDGRSGANDWRQVQGGLRVD